jgi:ADP-ribosylglycohydrolase
MMDRHDRYRGCLLGGAVGDALGAPVEFMSREEIVGRFGARGIREFVPAFGKLGAITDDTQMMLFTAEGLLRAFLRGATRGIVSIESVVARAYVRWLATQGVTHEMVASFEGGWLMEQRELFARRAPGSTCLAALTSLRDVGDRAGNESKGCGGVMRVAPVGMAFAGEDDIGRTFDLASNIAAITHGHPTGYLAAGAFAVVVSAVLVGNPLPAAIAEAKDQLRRRQDHGETLGAIEQAEMLAASGAHSFDQEQLGEGWIAEEALAIALFCALRAEDFESGVVMAVNHDGDSDSTGAITGNILGAMHGVHAIPKRWLEPLELRAVIASIADDLAEFRGWHVWEYGDPEHARPYLEKYPPI